MGKIIHCLGCGIGLVEDAWGKTIPGNCKHTADCLLTLPRTTVWDGRIPPPSVVHLPHYGGADDPFEARKVIRAWALGFNLGNVAKYIRRAGSKPGATRLQDLEKAAFYLADEINAEKERNA